MSGAAAPKLLTAHTQRVTRLYRAGLKNLLNWCVHRDLWISEAFKLQAEFRANKSIKDPRLIEKLVSDGEAKLAEYAHPDPYTSEWTEHRRIRLIFVRVVPLLLWPRHPFVYLFGRFFFPQGSLSLTPSRLFLYSNAVPTMPGGSKYMRHPNNGLGPPEEIIRIPSYFK